MDLSLKTYQDASKMKSVLKGYINTLADFEGVEKFGKF